MNQLYQLFVTCMVTVGLLTALTANLSADVVEYDDVVTDSVLYSGLIETSESDGELHGQPFAVGSNFVSNGLGFESLSFSGDSDVIAGQLQLTITASEGMEFNELNIATLGNFFGRGDQAILGAHSSAHVIVGGESFSSSTIFHDLGSAPESWGTDFTVTFPDTHQISVTLLVQLMTDPSVGSLSSIDASNVQLSVNLFTAAIPEPVTAWWLATGMLLVCRRHRAV